MYNTFNGIPVDLVKLIIQSYET